MALSCAAWGLMVVPIDHSAGGRSCSGEEIHSGDRDLLVLGDRGPVPVLSPRQFWDPLQSDASGGR